ncbi:MAG: hypothetical protein ACYC1C_03255 [Chloroflexota bacterium]
MRSDHDVTVVIQSGRGSREFTFAKQMKVQDAANTAASALGYAPGGAYVLVRLKTNDELEGQRPLVSYHIEDGESLALSETGSGV